MPARSGAAGDGRGVSDARRLQSRRPRRRLPCSRFATCGGARGLSAASGANAVGHGGTGAVAGTGTAGDQTVPGHFEPKQPRQPFQQ